eukprot:TRINITY_DN3374_c0_g1_i2.p1 TRINITY_DN3374_c0_g1~~TRINITY_DN3374_c0_g1_i2.p1  ORF type:complete len:795 (+),score=189.64 TRINITY_DN3374_c0_g1_i2:126-2510(+)
MAQSSVFAKAYAAGRGTPSSARSSASAGKGAQPKAAAGSKAIVAAPTSKAAAGSKTITAAPTGKAGKAPAPSKPAAKIKASGSVAGADNDDEEQGVLTCANRGLLQQMLKNANINENDEDGEDDASDDGADADGGDGDDLSMSLRNVSQFNPMNQGRSVPTITSPPARPVSRSGVPSQTVRPASWGGLESQTTRPASRGGLESQTYDPRPASRNGPTELQRGRQGPPGASIYTVTTGAPKPAAASYVSMARPGSRGAGGGEIPVSGGEIVSRQQPVQRPAQIRGAPAASVRQPPGAVPAASVRQPPGAGYANMHQARGRKPGSPAVQPFSPAAKPAARPLCGPSAFQFLKHLDDSKKSQAASAQESQGMSGSEDDMAHDLSEQDDAGFVMPASDAESDESDRPRKLGEQPSSAVPSSDAAADYVEQVKRGFGLAAGNGVMQPQQPVPKQEPRISNQPGNVAAAFAEMGLPPPEQRVANRPGNVAAAFAELGLPPPDAVTATGSSQSARSRSSDSRQVSVGGGGQAPNRTLARSRSSDPRAAVAAARLAAAQNSDDDDDDDEEDAGQAIQWKADVRSMVKNFAQEERGKAAKQGGTTAIKPSGDSGVTTRKPPRAPAPAPEPVRRAQAEDDQPIAVVSKKPRAPVDYTPATVDAYKQKYGAAKPDKSELGHLGPDLDDDNLLMKKAVQNKVKEFSKELHRINRQRSLAANEKPKSAPKPEPKSTARSKALEYAQNIPKPKVQAQPKVVVTSSPTKTSGEVQDEADWEDIRRREQQHFEDVTKVVQIKDFLAKLPF